MKTSTLKKMTFTLIMIALSVVSNAASIVRYVTLNGSGDFSGSSWENAADGMSASIQAQIDFVFSNEDRGEVRFGAGTYALTATLTLKDGASLIGGYAATPVTGTNDTRNWVTNQTIFDGGDARKLLNAPDGAGILYSHITMIDGLIIQRGRGSYGSAVAICYGFVMQNCIIRNNAYNSSSSVGGAIRIYRNSGAGASSGTPGSANCGGALINCIIVNNSTNKGAAAVSIDSYTSSSIINCVIANNITTDPALVKVRNTNARGYYGSVYIGSYAHGSKVVNNIFYNNSNNGQKDCDKHIGSTFYVGTLYNNYFDGDQAFKDSVAVYYERPTSIAYGYYKNFNTNNNKCNVDFAASTIFEGANSIIGSATTPEDADAINASNWKLKTGSGCIDAGISTSAADVSFPYIFISSAGAANRTFSTILTDLSGNTRIIGINPDMGAYEFGSSIYNATPQVLESGLLIVKGKTIEFQVAASKLEIYNLMGSMIHSQQNINTGSSVLLKCAGIYIVKINSEQGIKVQKIIVQ